MKPCSVRVRVLLVAFLPLLFLGGPADAEIGDRSPDRIWQEVVPPIVGELADPGLTAPPVEARTFALDELALDRSLRAAPTEFSHEAKMRQNRISLPLPDGTFASFRVEESPIMAPRFAARYPSIRTYEVRGLDEPSDYGRISWTPRGLHGLIHTGSGAVWIGRHLDGGVNSPYVSAVAQPAPLTDLACGSDVGAAEAPAMAPATGAVARRPGKGAVTTRGSVDPVPLRKFTIALAVSYDWCNAPPANGDADDALEQVTIIFNSVKGKYRRDFGIDLELLWVPFCEPEHEHYYTDGTGLCDAVHDQNQALLDATGEDYDVGHVFVSAQGSYQYGCVSGRACNATTQAMGASRFITSNAQAGIWLLSHELGHQFNAQHTFNVECDFGGNGNRIEPGSGATLMSYWGFCTSNGEHDVAGPVYPYFHAMSIREVDLFTDGDGDCWEPVDIGNHAPVVTDEFDGTSSECAGGGHGGEDVKCLPPETPFRLKGTSQDQDGGGTSPTFIWEQFNSGTDDTPLGVDPGSGPLFRSYRPMADRHTRVFPPLDHVLNGTLPKGEVLPIVTDRRLFFRLTARDPDGATGYDNRMLYVADGPPLEVTSPSGTITGGMNTVTWEASAVEATGADTVDILFSSSEPEDLDDFVVLLGDVPNDGGTATVEIPNEVSDEARIMVAPVNEVFFAVSDPLTVELLPVCPATDFCSQGCATANCRSRAIGGSQCTDDDELQVCDEGETIYRTTCDCVDPGAVPLGGGNVIPTLGCDGGTGTWWSCQ